MENENNQKQVRGFAAMHAGLQREVARKGGLAVSRDLQHMSQIGSIGGRAVSQDRQHMAEIGRLGAAARVKKMRERRYGA
jgi:hypothetical protein